MQRQSDSFFDGFHLLRERFPISVDLKELAITSLFVWGRGVIEHAYLMNITVKILLAFKFELTQKYSATS